MNGMPISVLAVASDIRPPITNILPLCTLATVLNWRDATIGIVLPRDFPVCGFTDGSGTGSPERTDNVGSTLRVISFVAKFIDGVMAILIPVGNSFLVAVTEEIVVGAVPPEPTVLAEVLMVK